MFLPLALTGAVFALQHVHGVGTAGIAADANGRVEILLELPSDTAFGFERAPRSEEEMEHIQSVTASLTRPEIFGFNSDAGCQFVSAQASSIDPEPLDIAPATDAHETHDHHDGHDEHGHDDHAHEEHGHDEHGHDEHGHDHHGHDHAAPSETTHSDLGLNYVFQCENALRSLDLTGVFNTLPRLETLDVTYLDDRRQTAAELTPTRTRIDLGR